MHLIPNGEMRCTQDAMITAESHSKRESAALEKQLVFERQQFADKMTASAALHAAERSTWAALETQLRAEVHLYERRCPLLSLL